MEVVTRGKTEDKCLSGEIDAIIISGKIITGAVGGGLGVLVMECFIISDTQTSYLTPQTEASQNLISKSNLPVAKLSSSLLWFWTCQSFPDHSSFLLLVFSGFLPTSREKK